MTGLKDDAQNALLDLAKQCPVGLYAHYKGGGGYVVTGHSLDEATLAPLVHYVSLTKGYRWTRTLENFVELVNNAPRFTLVHVLDRETLRKEFGL